MSRSCHVIKKLSRWLSPGKWMKLACQDKIGKWLSPGRWTKVLRYNKFSISWQSLILRAMPPNGPVVWGVAVCVGVGMCFCKVPVDGRWLSRQDKVVKVMSPGKRTGVFSSRYNCLGGDAKTMTTARRTAALLTLSRQQDQSGYHKI